MSEALTRVAQTPRLRGMPLLAMQIGWRNLWRNGRRTWLTSGGIAFAILLVVFMMALQAGGYGAMTENATSLLTGHLQIQNPEYVDDQRFEHTITDATALLREIEAAPGVRAAAPRVEAFALASAGERSVGARIFGVDIAAEERTVRFLTLIKEGRSMQGSDEAVLGAALARNLGLSIGDEVVLLGSSKEGGVAALVLDMVGIFESGMVELDRGLLLAPLESVRNGFDLGDEIHTIAVRTEGVGEIDKTLDELRNQLGGRDDVVVRHWDEVLPELRQSIEVDKLGGQLMYGIVMVLVVFSVVNSFIMTVFERTREFGMLLAIGSRPRSIVALVMWEALFIWALGTAIGLGLAGGLVWWLSEVGIYLGEDMQQIATQYYLPARMYPAFSAEAMLTAPVIMFFGTQLAALLPSLRIHHLKPVEALRTE